MITLEYLKGILRTYAHLNMPNSDLMYQYDLIEFENSKEISEVLKTNLGINENAISYLNKIDERYLKKSLNEWFFENGELRHLPLNNIRKDNEITSFYNALILFTQLQSMHLIIINDYDTNIFIGIMYSFFVIKGAEKSYILYFLYSD